MIIGSHRTQLRFGYLELVHLGLVWFITKSDIYKVALRPATSLNQEWKVKLKPCAIGDVGLDCYNHFPQKKVSVLHDEMRTIISYSRHYLL